jgi:hypothetical protein
MPQDNRTAGGLDQAMYMTDAEYEAAQEVAAMEEEGMEQWAKLLKERFLNAATGKDVCELPTGGFKSVSYVHWRELLGDYCCSSTEAEVDEPAEIAGLCAAGNFTEAQLRSLALLNRCADWYVENNAEDTFDEYLEELHDEAESFL